MRLATLRDRAVLVVGDGRAVDVETASGGRFGPDPMGIYAVWDDFAAWAADAEPRQGESLDVADLGAPSPRPGQVFAIGLNYRAHAAEVGVELPRHPIVFTKFPSCIVGPVGEIAETSTLDWEVELVVVIGRAGRRIPVGSAWEHVAGLAVGQDYSHRGMQGSGPVPQQWSMAKSFPGFGPVGPWLVTPDELADRDDLRVETRVNGAVVQDARTSDLIFPVGELVAHLSGVVTLRPGDLVFTGTPAGVAMGRPDTPWLKAGDVVVTTIEGIGTLRQTVSARE